MRLFAVFHIATTKFDPRRVSCSVSLPSVIFVALASIARTMSSSKDRSMDTQVSYIRQAVILRKNIQEWDRMVRGGFGGVEDWPKSLGRLNAALNQTVNMDQSIDDVMEHFVYLPRQATANPQDVPFFLSTRLEDEGGVAAVSSNKSNKNNNGADKESKDELKKEFSLDPSTNAVEHLMQYEKQAAELAAEYERQMVRF